MSTRIVKSVILLLTLIVCGATTAAAADVALWGSTTCQKRFLEPGAGALEKATGVRIKVYGVGTGKGMLALLDGKAEVAIASNSLEGAIKSARKVLKKDGRPDATMPSNLQFHQITEDVIVPIVHKDNPVDRLDWEQLSKLNTGEIANWKQLGGPNLPVQVVTSHAGSSTREVFQSQVMHKADFAPGAVMVKSTRLEINEVSREPGGIGAVSAGFYTLNPGNAKVVETERISRPLALITAGKPSPEVQKIIDFFRSSEGQKYIVD